MKLTKMMIKQRMRKDMKTTLGMRYVFSYKGKDYVAFGTEKDAVEDFYKRLK